MSSTNNYFSIKALLVSAIVGCSSVGVIAYFCANSFAEQEKLISFLKRESFVLGNVVSEAGLRSNINSSEAQWADYNGDGALDVAICCENCPPRLYQNLGDGRMIDQSDLAGISCPRKSPSKACFWFDYNNDQFQDLFISYTDGNAHFFHNNGDGTFSNVTSDLASPMLNQFDSVAETSTSGI